ncbi:MAG: DUF2478 domain-containing protein [Methylocystaceae bacterium]|nr:DUF2478 domain-containing protein [Methylocystaceae bacterium]
MSTETAKPIRLGGVLYAADTPERDALRDFAHDLQKRGWHVAGLVQQNALDENGDKIGLDAIDLQTGEHLPLARPSKEDRETGTCGFDVGKLTETSTVLRRAIQDQADLLVIEKFGEREQDGRGLADEIVGAAMAGIPTLVAVPASALETWNDFTGRLGTLIPHERDSLWQWWPKWNLYKELALNVDDVPVNNIIMGKNVILVEGPHGCGVTTNPLRQSDITTDMSISLKQLALEIQNRQAPLKHALSIAAILAHYNHYDLEGPDNSGLAHFEKTDNNVLVVGNFPTDKAYSNNSHSIATPEALQHLIEHAYEGVILPSHTFGDGLLPTLLRTKAMAEAVLVGPETPMATALFDYGIDVLSGRIITDPEQAKEIVKQDGTLKDLKAASRYITLQK